MSRRIIQLTVVLAVGFAVLLVQLTNLGFIAADGLRRHELNTRAAAAAVGNARGAIVSADGETLAPGISHDDTGRQRRRTYPHGPLYAHTVGYLGTAVGASGIERSYDGELSGTTTGIAVRELTDLFADSGRVGDVIVTLHHGVQLTARAALGDRDGAVVVVDPATGAVIAMWSRPSFDPDALVALAPGTDRTLAQPPIARAYRRHYALSADASFGTSGVELLEGARRAPGPTGIDLPGEPDEAASSGVNIDHAGTLDGDGELTLVTPLQLALATAAVANDGVRMRPHVVHRVDARSASHAADGEPPAPDASVETAPREARRLFETASAAGLLERMAAEAQHASIRLEPTDGIQVGAAIATGRVADLTRSTAQTGSWAVVLAPADAPTVAVAVLIEPDAAVDIADPQGGGTLATMIAATAAETALALRALPQPEPDRP